MRNARQRAIIARGFSQRPKNTGIVKRKVECTLFSRIALGLKRGNCRTALGSKSDNGKTSLVSRKMLEIIYSSTDDH